MTYDARKEGAFCGECPRKDKKPVPPARPKKSLQLIVVGEAPGRFEEKTGEPFIGPSGKLLNTIFGEVGFDRAHAFISNAALCRGEEDTLPLAMACCAPRLGAEINKLPKDVPILALGSAAIKPLIGRPGIQKTRGFVWTAPEVPDTTLKSTAKLLERREASDNPDPERIIKARAALRILQGRRLVEGRIVVPSLHPAYLLRGADSSRPLLVTDIDRVVRWSRKPFQLEDEGSFYETNDPVKVRKLLARMREEVAVDIESNHADPITCHIDCIGISDDYDGKGTTLVINPWRKSLVPILNEALAKRVAVTHNGPAFDQIAMARKKLFFKRHEDTLIAHHAYASHMRQGLDHVVSVYCDAKAWKRLFHMGAEEKGVAKFGVKAEDLAQYNAADVRLDIRCWKRMQPDLAPEMEVYRRDMEIARLCQEMQVTGLRLDDGKRKSLSKQLRARSGGLLGEMRRVTRRRGFNPARLSDVRRALFTQFKAPSWLMPLTPTGMPSTASGMLEALQVQDTRAGHLADLILRWRSSNDTRSEYLDNIETGPDGRVHAGWRSYGTECLPAGELVLTSRGYLPVEEVRVGDGVLTHKGRVRKVTVCSKHKAAPIYRVKLSNGLTLRTTGSHPYRVGNGWVDAEYLEVGYRVAIHSRRPEEWRPVPDWPYEVSSWGRVRGRYGRMVRLQKKGSWGYLKLCLKRNGARKRGPDMKDIAVHRLVMMVFGSNRVGAPEVRHSNGIAWDNTVDNLRWGTSLENRGDAVRHGTMTHRKGRQAKLTEEAVAIIRERKREPWEYAALGDRFGVSRGLVRDVYCGRRWQPAAQEAPRMEFPVARVVAIKREAAEVSYGLTIDEDESHVTGGIVTHNTGRPATRRPNILNTPRLEMTEEASRAISRLEKAAREAYMAEMADAVYELESLVRTVYVAGEGKVFLYFDLSQAEMRFAAYLSGDPVFMKTCEGDVHIGNACILFPKAADIIRADPKGAGKKYRDIAKNAGFAVSYLSTADTVYAYLRSKGFAVSLGDVHAMLERIKAGYAKYYEYVDGNIAFARRHGYVRTFLTGRIRHTGYHPKPTVIANFPIQSGVADIMGERLLEIDAKKPKAVKLVMYAYDAGVYELEPKHLESMKNILRETWARPIFVPHNGQSFIQPIDMKEGGRLSDF